MTDDELQEKTARELQWPALLRKVSEGCRGPVAAAQLQQLRPAPDHSAAVIRMGRTREAIILSAGTPLPAGRLEDMQSAFDALEHGSSLGGSELKTIAGSLEIAARLRAYLDRNGEAAPLLAAFLKTSDDLAPLQEQLLRCLGTEGEILDTASPELKRARGEMQSIRQQLRSRLERISEQFGEALQGQYVVEREGRYVLPIRSDAPFRVEGLVLGSSASGNTVYLEPRGTHELGNKMQRNEAVVRSEEARVLKALNVAVQAQLQEVRCAYQAGVQMDILHAIALYAARYNAHALEPQSDSNLQLINMRHPLLLGQEAEVVSNNLTLNGGQGLIVSGPNAGGKTVALKCLGLAAWMVRCGLPITADKGSTVGWFARVFTDIGDNQSLTHSLSTFSAHMGNIKTCLSHRGPQTLVLIDELCGGTDPDEGGALALAIVEALVEGGCAVCITTHYEQLKSAAALATTLVNAAVGFDRERMLPTYDIKYGVPGASSALLVAERYGIAPAIVSRALFLMPEGTLDARALTIELETERATLLSDRQAAQQELADVRKLRDDLERQIQRARTQERLRLSTETDRVLDEVRSARKRLAQAEAQLKTTSTATDLGEAHAAVNEVAKFVAIGGQLRRTAMQLHELAPTPVGGLTWDSLSIGAIVTLKSLGATGTVVAKPKRDQLTVRVGSMKTTVRLEELAPGPPPTAKSGTGKNAPAKRHRTIAMPSAQTAAEPMRTESNTCNLRGQRVDDALQLLDAFIDQMLRDGGSHGFILHGHGTGALKTAVRQHLRGHRAVNKAQSAGRDDGGDAFTVFWTD